MELTDEREKHIAEPHPDLLPAHGPKIADTLAKPDKVRRSTRIANTWLFSHWFDALRGGKHIVVVVVSQYNSPRRHWTITAYVARRLTDLGVQMMADHHHVEVVVDGVDGIDLSFSRGVSSIRFPIACHSGCE
ncbi:MAG: hypothetical protein ACREX3_15990 [Gammaproteobacteria bacterium]